MSEFVTDGYWKQIQRQALEIESLRQQLHAAKVMLADSQLREQRLMDTLSGIADRAFDVLKQAPSQYYQGLKNIMERACAAKAPPQDPSELEAMIAKAGEVMRERVFKEVRTHYLWTSADKAHETIRLLPSVTMEDLR